MGYAQTRKRSYLYLSNERLIVIQHSLCVNYRVDAIIQWPLNLRIRTGYPQAQMGRPGQPPPRPPAGLNLKQNQGGQGSRKGGSGSSAKNAPPVPRKQRPQLGGYTDAVPLCNVVN